MKSTQLGGPFDIFANNTVISSRRAKHASVCLLMLRIKERFCRSLSNTGEGKHSLYCADLSLSPYFIPPLPGPRKDSLILSPRNKLGGLQTTHRAAHGSFLLPLLSGSQCFFFLQSLLIVHISVSLPLTVYISPPCSLAEVEEMLRAHSSISPFSALALCSASVFV